MHIFGTIPTPAGEETMENWVDQPMLMLTECECSEKEKWRIIVERLKGPALEIIKTLLFICFLSLVLCSIFNTRKQFQILWTWGNLSDFFAQDKLVQDFLRRMKKSLITCWKGQRFCGIWYNTAVADFKIERSAHQYPWAFWMKYVKLIKMK